MAYIIKDLDIDEYYRQRAGNGWYSSDINNSRLFTTEEKAQETIDSAGHHVTYPGDRNLKVIEVKICPVS